MRWPLAESRLSFSSCALSHGRQFTRGPLSSLSTVCAPRVPRTKSWHDRPTSEARRETGWPWRLLLAGWFCQALRLAWSEARG